MEEWHQKLHNNTSPDDVVICQVRPSCCQYRLTGNILLYYSCEECYVLFCLCEGIAYSQSCTLLETLKIRLFHTQALLEHIKSGFNMDVYWKTLNDNGVTKERMRSYDRPIVSEPKLRADQKDGLIRDLTNYLRTLKVGTIILIASFPAATFSRFLNLFGREN
jgi:hypothetical protein